jgi:molecular chaperone DnaJ
LTLEEVATGVEKKIRLKHLKRCSTCHGKGGSGEQQCTQCQGRGQVRRVQQSVFGQFVNVSTCPRCDGAGQIFKDPCATCHGDGRVQETETITVKVPAGVSSGNFIPLRGLGDAGPRGGTAGDLIVIIEEKEHALFEREGNDCISPCRCRIRHSRSAARSRCRRWMAAPATVHVHAGSPSGHVSRLRGKGLPSLRGHKGDLVTRLEVWVPERLPGADKKLLEELGRSESMRPPRPGKSRAPRSRDAHG